MERRKFLRQGALAAAGVAAISACSESPRATDGAPQSDALESVTWHMATSWPTNFPIFEHSAQRLAENVRIMSRGRFTIHVDSASKHKSPLGVFDFVREGQYQMGHSASYYWKGKDPALTTFTTTPFGMTAQEQNAWFWYGGGIELMQNAYAKHNMVSYNGGNTGVQMGGWFRKEIESLSDLEGLKMRIPGLAGEVIARVGATPVNIAAGELYTSLEKNVIDALEWVGPHLDMTMGFHKIADYYYTGWHEPAAELQFLINKPMYESLPDDLRTILLIAMKEASFDMLCEGTYRNSVKWEEIKRDYPNIKIRSFPKEVIDELRRQTHQLLDEMAGESDLLKEILDSQRTFLALARNWTEVSEQLYLSIR